MINVAYTPHSPEAEMAVISSMVEDSTVISRVEFLNDEDFYMMPHKVIFNVIMAEYKKGNAVDINLISDKVPDEAGGFAYLVDIVKTKSTPRNIVSYAKKIVELSIRRSAIESYNNAVNGLTDVSTEYMTEISTASEKVDRSLSRLSNGDILTVDELINMTADEMEKSLQDIRLGIGTGIPEIDDRLGYQKLATGEITYLGAPSKNGKTLFANTISARCDLLDDECAHIFSIEMPALGMFNGVVSALSGVPSNFYARQAYYSKVMPGRYDEWMAKWGSAAHELKNNDRITIDGKKDVTMMYICSEMRKQHQLMENKGKKLKLVVIDHLHRIAFDTSKKPMTYAMGDDVRMLKNTASDLGIAVLLLGQLNEACKDREPTAFDILDTSRVRHEIQCFIGTKIFRENGNTYFGIYSDAHRYADHETQFHPAYVRLIAGVVRSLGDNEKHWTPSKTNEP
jgi:replicative DNA helicase